MSMETAFHMQIERLRDHLAIIAARQCRVCGSDMVLGSSDSMGTVFHCEKAGKEWEASGYPVRASVWEHLTQSSITLRGSEREELGNVVDLLTRILKGEIVFRLRDEYRVVEKP